MKRFTHFEQFFGLWCCETTRLRQGLQLLRGIDLQAHLEQRAAARQERGGEPAYTVDGDGAATLEIVGPISKYGSSLFDSPSTIALRRSLRAAVADAQVKTIVLLIDSPGGTAAGVDDLAADVAAANRTKPVGAYIEDLGASAAYYVASQAGTVAANPAALVGAIGTYAIVYDESKAAETAGIKVLVIKAAEFKGAGAPGTEITTGQLAEFQREIDSVNGLFLAAVGRGRKLSSDRVAAVATGQVWIAAEAQTLGLIDTVQTFSEFKLALPRRAAGSAPGQRRVRSGRARPKTMSEGKDIMSTDDDPIVEPEPASDAPPPALATVAEPPAKAATVAELKAALPKSSAEFREACLLAGLTVPQAQAMHLASPAPARPGAAPLQTGVAPPAAGGDFIEVAMARAAEQKTTLVAAMSAIAKERPELHSAWLASQPRNRRSA